MIESSTLRGLCIFISILILGIFGYLEKETGIPFISNLSYFITIVLVLSGIIIFIFFLFNKKLKEEEDEEQG